MANAARNLDGILTGSGFIDYLDLCRKDAMEAYDALHEASQLVYHGIRRAGHGAPWAMGLDTRVVARRIRRALQHAADMHLEAAKAESVAASTYHATVGTAVTGRPDSSAFDPTK